MEGKDLKRIECDPKCEFTVQGFNENEVIELAKEHVKTAHHQEASAEEIKKMMVFV